MPPKYNNTDKHVLVPQASAIGMIGVIRSLGRARFNVHACDANPDATGLRSRFANFSAVHPAYSSPDFLPWLRHYLDEHQISLIIPSEGLLVAIRQQPDQFLPLMPMSQDWGTVERCFSKALTLSLFMQADPNCRAHLPMTLVINRSGQGLNPADLSELPLPIFVKTDGVLGSRPTAGGEVICMHHREGIPELTKRLLRDYSSVLIQGCVHGVKATVNLFLWEGEILCKTMAVALHESPHTGGQTALRKTWWHDEMMADAIARMSCLNWTGVVMVEYKWDDATQTFNFVEANTRFWAALHLDLFAGSDVPVLVADAFYGRPVEPLPRQPVGVWARQTVPGEIGYVVSRFRDRSVPLMRRLWAVVEFFLLMMKPGMRSDLLFRGDQGLYWYQWRKYLRGVIG